jgi:hypothetical protein
MAPPRCSAGVEGKAAAHFTKVTANSSPEFADYLLEIAASIRRPTPFIW